MEKIFYKIPEWHEDELQEIEVPFRYQDESVDIATFIVKKNNDKLQNGHLSGLLMILCDSAGNEQSKYSVHTEFTLSYFATEIGPED